MKIKSLIIVLMIIFLAGCSMYNVDDKSIEEIINVSVSSETSKANINNKGYRYYLPASFEVLEDATYNQILISESNKYYLYLDVVSYYYKKDIMAERSNEDYLYYEFKSNNKKGYIKIKEEDNYLIEIAYNYGIIEVRVEKEDIKYAVLESMNILKSIEYNDLVIEKYIGDNDIESSETIYEIPSPDEKSKQNILEYIE